MSAIKSISEAIAELTTVENALMWAHEYHTNEAKKNAAAHATWSVRYPPIVAELEAAQNAAGKLRDHFAKAKEVEDSLMKVLDKFAPKPSDHVPPSYFGFDPVNTIPCSTDKAKTPPSWQKEYDRLTKQFADTARGNRL